MKLNTVKLQRSSTDLTTTELGNGLEFTLCQRPFTDVVVDQEGAAELIGTLWQHLADRLGGEAVRGLVDVGFPVVDGTCAARHAGDPPYAAESRFPANRPWETVDQSGEPDEVTLRLRVPGGWLYRVDVAGFSSLVFVPAEEPGDREVTGH